MTFLSAYLASKSLSTSVNNTQEGFATHVLGHVPGEPGVGGGGGGEHLAPRPQAPELPLRPLCLLSCNVNILNRVFVIIEF